MHAKPPATLVTVAGVLLIALAACQSPDASSVVEDASSSSAERGSPSATDSAAANADDPASADPFFTLTVSGPAFPTPQTFRVDPERIGLNLATVGGFVTSFQDPNDPVPSQDETFFLRMFMGGIGPGLLQTGPYDHGPVDENVDGWGIIIWPAACIADRDSCDRIRMKTLSGTLDVSRYDQGKAASRPHAEGPTAIAARADLTAVGQEDHTGQDYTIEWAFHLIDS